MYLYTDAWFVILDWINLFENMQIKCVNKEMYQLVNMYISYLENNLSKIQQKVATGKTVEMMLRYQKQDGWGIACKHEKERFLPLQFLRDDMLWIDRNAIIRIVRPRAIILSIFVRLPRFLHSYKYRIDLPEDWPTLCPCINHHKYRSVSK